MKDMLQNMIDAILLNSGANGNAVKFSQENVNLISGMWNYFAIVGIGMTLIYFILEMNRKFALEGGDLTIKSFFAPFLKLLLAIAIISQGGKIVGVIIDLNNAMVDKADGTEWVTGAGNALEDSVISGYTEADMEQWMNDMINQNPEFAETFKQNGGMASVVRAMHDSINKMGLMKLIAVVIPLLICFVISLVLKLIWNYKGLLYRIEVLFRLGIAPISFADVYSGQNSNAIRYLKGFLALGIYGVSLVVLPKLALNLVVVDLVTTNDVWEMIKALCNVAFIAPFAALSCANAARTAAKEALGA